MHVLITGGAGFIGSQLAEYHLDRGDKVHVVDDLSTGSKENIEEFAEKPGFHFDEADILTWPGLEKAAAWADRVYHMAAVVGVYRVLAEPIKVLSTNIAGTERLLRAIHAGGWSPQVILASTSEVYGHTEARELREDAPLVIQSGARSRWNYAVSKLADEALGLSYARKHGLQITIVRFCNTIGPRQTGRYGMVLPRFVAQALRGEPLTVYGDGNQTRSFCDVRDTVAALDALASNPASGGEIVNVGNNREISILDLAKLIIRTAESTSKIKKIPYLEAYGEDFEDITHRRPALDKLFGLTDFSHNWTLEETVQDLLDRSRNRVAKVV
ncbi:NAD(P)-dependent oxidoreductase [Desulfuromonas sp. TF]|uniref:NAD-dependent epimerase/dehydratase family protein n=1 Tax=Desulfuromonas sp. TF TaxID=1232410 RepID=UPI000423A410|nr:NAD-dependent epimerase/dehydratase family protein [Desulfuromonas sp. TF]